MTSKTQILSTEKDGTDGLIVTFTDGTIGAYVAEELLELRPVREQVSELDEHALPVPAKGWSAKKPSCESPAYPHLLIV
jgi:hypothetical protein